MLPITKLDQLINDICDYYQVPIGFVIPKKDSQKNRLPEYVLPRQHICYIAKEHLGISYPYISRKLKHNDHTTALYYHKKILKSEHIRQVSDWLASQFVQKTPRQPFGFKTLNEVTNATSEYFNIHSSELKSMKDHRDVAAYVAAVESPATSIQILRELACESDGFARICAKVELHEQLLKHALAIIHSRRNLFDFWQDNVKDTPSSKYQSTMRGNRISAR